jgi:hypothetical protein
LGWSALVAGHLGCCQPDCGHVRQRLGTGRRGRAVTVNVTVAYTTLIGVDDQPAHLHGYGPIGAEVARRIAAQGTWRRLLTNPVSGAMLDVGRSRYTPPPDLADHITARDQTCRFPTCTRSAETGDLDHTTPFERGGSTSAGNLGPLHRGHHNDKTHHGWQLHQPKPGRFVWTAPTGHRYEVDPEIVGLLPPTPTRPAPTGRRCRRRPRTTAVLSQLGGVDVALDADVSRDQRAEPSSVRNGTRPVWYAMTTAWVRSRAPSFPSSRDM